MKITKVISQQGQSITIPIHDADQTVAVNIVGNYEGLFQIKGFIDPDGGDMDIIPYSYDGSVLNITTEPPLNFFLDVSGVILVKITFTELTSGTADITANVTSSSRANASGGTEGGGTVDGATEITAQASLAQLQEIKDSSAFLAGNAALLTSTTIVGVDTSGIDGTTFVPFASSICDSLDIVNTRTGCVAMEIRRGGSGETIMVPAYSSRLFVKLSNANELQVRREDQISTTVHLTAEAFKI